MSAFFPQPTETPMPVFDKDKLIMSKIENIGIQITVSKLLKLSVHVTKGLYRKYISEVFLFILCTCYQFVKGWKALYNLNFSPVDTVNTTSSVIKCMWK